MNSTPHNKVLYVRLPIPLWTDVKIEAARSHRSARAVTEAALTLYLNRHSTKP